MNNQAKKVLRRGSGQGPGLALWGAVRNAVGQKQNGEQHESVTMASEDAVYKENREMAKRLKMIMPEDWRLALWNRWMLACILWTYVFVPLTVSTILKFDWGIFVIDWVTTMSYLTDIILVLRTALNTDDEVFVVEPLLVRKRYFRGWFAFDLLTSLPYQLAMIWDPYHIAYALLALPRMGRLTIMFRRFDVLATADITRMYKLILFFLIFTHIVGCMWWIIGILEVIPYEDDISVWGHEGLEDSKPWVLGKFDEWQDGANITSEIDNVESAQKYFASFYWSLTTLVKTPWIGPGPVPEKIAATIFVVAGAVIFAMILGNITSMVQSFDRKNAELSRKTNNIATWSANRLPPDMQRRLHHYVNQYSGATRGLSESEMIAQVPFHFRGPVLISMHRDLCAVSPLLSKLSAAAKAMILSSMQEDVVLSGDELIAEGSLGLRYYLLQYGELQVTSTAQEQNKKAKLGQGRIVTKGALVGFQDCMKPVTPYNYSVKALKRCGLLGITAAAFKSAYETFKKTADGPIVSKVVRDDLEQQARRVQAQTSQRASQSTASEEGSGRRSSEHFAGDISASAGDGGDLQPLMEQLLDKMPEQTEARFTAIENKLSTFDARFDKMERAMVKALLLLMERPNSVAAIAE